MVCGAWGLTRMLTCGSRDFRALAAQQPSKPLSTSLCPCSMEDASQSPRSGGSGGLGRSPSPPPPRAHGVSGPAEILGGPKIWTGRNFRRGASGPQRSPSRTPKFSASPTNRRGAHGALGSRSHSLAENCAPVLPVFLQHGRSRPEPHRSGGSGGSGGSGRSSSPPPLELEPAHGVSSRLVARQKFGRAGKFLQAENFDGVSGGPGGV